MLRHFLPRKLEADVVFSMGEPDQTGYVLAAVSCIPFRNARIKRIEPDFESEEDYFGKCQVLSSRKRKREFPGHPVVRTPCFSCRGPEFNP